MDSLLLLLTFSFISLFFLLLISSRQSSTTCRSTNARNSEEDLHRASWTKSIRSLVDSFGGFTIFSFMLARVIGALAILLLSLNSQIQSCQEIPIINACVDSMTTTYVYCSLLAIASLTCIQRSRQLILHFQTLQLLVLGVYAYRDIWPLCTYFLKPEDSAEGNILWTKLSILFTLGIIIPIFVPNTYTPVYMQNPMAVPARESVDPWISRVLYIYMDPIVFLANKVSHLNAQQLPQIMDVDSAQYLQKQAFPHINPFFAGRRHLFWALLYYFRWEYFTIVICYVIAAVCTFASPVALVQILRSLETEDQNVNVKPWLWIVVFFVGGMLRSVSTNWSMYQEAIVSARLQAILTQLVFEHSLRIRFKAETTDNSSIQQNTSSDTASTFVHQSGEEPSTIKKNGDVASPDEESDSRGPTAVTSNPKGEDIAGTTSKSTENLIGMINNLVTSDIDTLASSTNFFSFVLFTPVQIVLSMIFLYNVLGSSAIISFVVIVGLGPIGIYVARRTANLQNIKMKLTDARIQAISEAIGIMRMVKLFGWENKMSAFIEQKREEELGWHWKIKALGVVNSGISNFIPAVAMFITYATFTTIMKEELTASKIFSSLAVFSILRDQILRLALETTGLIQAKVSLDRTIRFLKESELLDRYDTKGPSYPNEIEEHVHKFGLKNASFTWSAEESSNHKNFVLSIKDEVSFMQNRINLITGPTGSGKTSLLMALLGEMHFKPLSDSDSWFNLPRNGGIAYAAQESWIQNTTIRENILFGADYDETRFRKVVYQCALEHDLALFDAGDKTEVGERGLTLSGGQKARITLARAIYSNAQILLLDDIFSGLDVHTSSWIVNNCFRGDLIKGRTVLLVTHNTSLLMPITDLVVDVGPHGSVFCGQVARKPLMQGVEEEDLRFMSTQKDIDALPSVDTPEAEKLMISEEIIEGHVTWKSFRLLLSGLGGNRPFAFLTTLVTLIVANLVLTTIQTWFLGVWGEQYEHHMPSNVDLPFYLLVLAIIILSSTIVQMVLLFFLNYRMVCSSRIIHSKLIDSILQSTFRWLDQTPTGRIIARCTQDIRIVDTTVASMMFWVIDMAFSCLIKFGAILIVTPFFFSPGIAVALCGAVLANSYLKAQLSLKREKSNARSPVLTHFSAAIHGIVSIRAYGAQQTFRTECHKHIDHYTRVTRTSANLNRWMVIRTDTLSSSFITMLAFYQVYIQKTTAANAGFSLNMAVTFCVSVFYLIHTYNAFEVDSNSLERIQGYLDIDHEPRPVNQRKPPASWPTSGDLRVVNLSARYSPAGPNVLHGLNFQIKSGEHIGVVGRTGSGKTSLTLALLRCIFTEGTVYYDGISTQSVNVDALRSSVTVIPQLPELLSGTLRQNIDPFDEHDDAELNNALRAVGLFALQEQLELGLSLESNIASGGGNLSVGQRQIIALARAMIRGSRLLILDEATSAIDHKTDAIIQQSLRNEIGRNTTVITIAHRLQTVIDADRIMVLENGKIVEYDSPQVLLVKENGALRALVSENNAFL